MPTYRFTDPQTKMTLDVTGPSPPSESVLRTMFEKAAKESGQPARSSANIGPTPDNAPVTLGDVIDNPLGAVKRMVQITKEGLSNPRNTIPAAIGIVAGTTGLMPRSFASTRGLSTPEQPPPSAAPTRVGLGQALKENVSLDDVVGAIPGAHTAKAAYRVARGVQRAVQQTGKPATPAEVAPASAPTVAPSAPTAPTPEPVASESGMPSFDDLALTPAEITTAAKWHEQGVSPEMILHRILQSRQLTSRTRTTTPDQAAEAIRRRNQTGRWED